MLGILIAALIVVAVLLIMRNKSAPKDNRQVSNLSMLPERFVVFDLETTGLDSDRHEIIEIGAIRVNRDSKNHDTFSTLIKPRGRLSSKITKITGLDRATLIADGIAIEEALAEFRSFVGDLPLVAFNLEFDRAFLLAECRRAEMPPFPNNADCALNMARQAWPGRRSYKLSNICSDAGIKIVAEHRAFPDCERALHVYVAAAQRLGRCNI